MTYSARYRRQYPEPMAQMNITPLIDVMLVLLIMFIMVIPLTTNALLVPLPTDKGQFEVLEINRIHIDAQDRLFWNEHQVDRQGLLNQLATAAAQPLKPAILFEPDALASYDRSAKTIALIKDSGIEKFGFVGNERFRTFTNGD